MMFCWFRFRSAAGHRGIITIIIIIIIIFIYTTYHTTWRPADLWSRALTYDSSHTRSCRRLPDENFYRRNKTWIYQHQTQTRNTGSLQVCFCFHHQSHRRKWHHHQRVTFVSPFTHWTESFPAKHETVIWLWQLQALWRLVFVHCLSGSS